MPARLFIDSNILLYARDRALPAKAMTCQNWVQHAIWLEAAFINLQVLNEVTNVMLRKRRDLTEQQIFTEIDGLAQLGATPLDPSVTGLARSIRLRTQYRWWDCLLLASAVELNCTHFLSEDLQDGREIEGMTVVDPFAHRPEELFPPT